MSRRKLILAFVFIAVVLVTQLHRTRTMNKIFAWQKGLRGPTPVLFHNGIPVAADTGLPRNENLLVTIPIPLDSPNDLDELARRYPLQQKAA